MVRGREAKWGDWIRAADWLRQVLPAGIVMLYLYL